MWEHVALGVALAIIWYLLPRHRLSPAAVEQLHQEMEQATQKAARSIGEQLKVDFPEPPLTWQGSIRGMTVSVTMTPKRDAAHFTRTYRHHRPKETP